MKSQPRVDDEIQCPPQEEKNCEEEPKLKIWALDYTVRGQSNYKGMAIVSAEYPSDAIRQLKADSMHNGKQDKIIVGEIQQIPFPLDQRLLFETYIKVLD